MQEFIVKEPESEAYIEKADSIEDAVKSVALQVYDDAVDLGDGSEIELLAREPEDKEWQVFHVLYSVEVSMELTELGTSELEEGDE